MDVVGTSGTITVMGSARRASECGRNSRITYVNDVEPAKQRSLRSTTGARRRQRIDAVANPAGRVGDAFLEGGLRAGRLAGGQRLDRSVRR